MTDKASETPATIDCIALPAHLHSRPFPPYLETMHDGHRFLDNDAFVDHRLDLW